MLEFDLVFNFNLNGFKLSNNHDWKNHVNSSQNMKWFILFFYVELISSIRTTLLALFLKSSFTSSSPCCCRLSLSNVRLTASVFVTVRERKGGREKLFWELIYSSQAKFSLWCRGEQTLLPERCAVQSLACLWNYQGHWVRWDKLQLHPQDGAVTGLMDCPILLSVDFKKVNGLNKPLYCQVNTLKIPL